MRIVLWNANGLAQYILEVKLFMKTQQIDILLISEIHFTNKNYFNISKYKFYHTIHSDGTAHGGSAVLIKNNIKHHEDKPYRTNEIQATNVNVEDWKGPVTIYSHI